RSSRGQLDPLRTLPRRQRDAGTRAAGEAAVATVSRLELPRRSANANPAPRGESAGPGSHAARLGRWRVDTRHETHPPKAEPPGGVLSCCCEADLPGSAPSKPPIRLPSQDPWSDQGTSLEGAMGGRCRALPSLT